VLKLILFVLPLGLDTFAVSAALGVGGMTSRERLRVSLVLSAFEMAMPVVGLLAGRGLGEAVGGVADYVAVGVLLPLGGYMLVADGGSERARVAGLASTRGLALLGLGIAISLDELAMGFTIGLLGLSIVAAVILIGVQAFAVSQLGLRIGSRLGERARERAERLAGVALIGLAALVLVERLL
jgi:putative Mn2+ efflux pump MntP